MAVIDDLKQFRQRNKSSPTAWELLGKDRALTLAKYRIISEGYSVASAAASIGISGSYLHTCLILKFGRDWHPTRTSRRGMLSPEARERGSAKLRGRPRSAETKAKISASRMWHDVSEHTKMATSHAHRGVRQPLETISKRAVSLRGHVVTEVTRKRIGLANKGKIRTQKFCQDVSRRRKGKVAPSGHIAMMTKVAADARTAAANAYAQGLREAVDSIRSQHPNSSLSAIAKEFETRQIARFEGGTNWTAGAIWRLLRRLDLPTR